MLKFLKFSLVGGVGALIQFAIVYWLTERMGFWYMFSMCIGIGLAVTWNFGANSLWTFKTSIGTGTKDYEWNAFYNGWIGQKWWKQRVAATIWDFIPTSKLLLDIACGSSPVIGHYNKAIGIDTNANKLEFMREKFPDLDFKYMKAQQIEYFDKSFDNVLCIEVMEHLDKPELVVKEIARLLKDGGTTVIATPDYSRYHWYLIENLTSYQGEHITKFTRQGLEALCRSNGLQPVKYEYIAGCDLVEMFQKVN